MATQGIQMHEMMKKVLSALVLMLLVQFCGTRVAQAQPDVNDTPKGINPPNRHPGVKGGPKQPPTPEQIAKRRAKRIEMRVSEIGPELTEAGFTDQALQTTVIDYYKSEQDARATLSEDYQKVVRALSDKNTPDTQLALLLSDLRASVAAEKTRQEKADADFSTKLKLSENPRLDAVLVMLGVTGDERALANRAAGMDNTVNALGKIAVAKPIAQPQPPAPVPAQ